MNESKDRKIVTVVGVLAALGLLAAGSQCVYQVYPDPNLKTALPPVSMPDFSRPAWAPPPPSISPPAPTEYTVSDLRLVENATFTGITKKEGQLWFTYDPTAQRGKRSCPT